MRKLRISSLVMVVALGLSSCASLAAQLTDGIGSHSQGGAVASNPAGNIDSGQTPGSRQSPRTQDTDAPEGETPETPEISERQSRILEAAETMLSTQSFLVNGRRYSYDCTGTILAIYAMAGVQLVDLFPSYSGNGVERLYRIAEDRDLLYHSEFPQPGDLIFWDNTYDKNGDKNWNDWLTHVGLVLAVGDDGTVDYLHHDYSQGVVRARMNLLDPGTYLDADGVIVNSPMRMRSHRYLNPDEWLASHLYRRLGAMHRINL